MRYQLDLTFRQTEGALARVLGTAGRRGFRPLAVDGRALIETGQPDGDRWHLRMTVEGERSDEQLQGQLAKLYDCLAVQVMPCA